METLETARKSHNYMTLTKVLASVDDAEFLSFGIWTHLDNALSIAATNDAQGTDAALEHAIKHSEMERRAFETNMENVDKQ
jgi:hypothetical protein